MRLDAWQHRFLLISYLVIAVLSMFSLLYVLIITMLASEALPRIFHAFPVPATYYCEVLLFDRPRD